MKRMSFLLLLMVGMLSSVRANDIPAVYPEQVGMNSMQLQNADCVINQAIREKQIPGAVLAVVRHGKMAYLKAYGNRQLIPTVESMTTNTIFDLASCTKPVATAMAVMLLIERGMLRTEDAVNMYLPHFQSWNGKQNDTTTIRISNLLTHTSGLPPYAPVKQLSSERDADKQQVLARYIDQCQRQYKPGTDMRYSCLNYITLQRIIEHITHQSLRTFCAENIFIPLGMNHTDFIPCAQDKKGNWTNTDQPRWGKRNDADAYPLAPTEQQANGQVLKGQVHDPLARVMNAGISGNAGLFSTASDLAVLCAMLQNGGSWNGKRILSPNTIQAMRTIPSSLKDLGRSLGWDVSSPYASNKGDLLSNETYGHTGYTGTSIVIDPVNDLSIILLTNCVHPHDKGNTVRLRALVANAVAASITNEEPLYHEHYYQRMLQFENEPAIQKNNIVMLGNSITEGGKDWAAKLGNKNVINRGISGDVATGIYDRLHTILPAHPAQIFLMVGVNDVSHDLSTDSIAHMIIRVTERIRRESPQTKLYLQSMLPIRESTGRWKRLVGKTEQIPEINARLQAWAKQNHVTYINLFPLFTEPGTHIMRQELTYDGLHLTEKGYEEWIKVLKKYL
ncbi:serine hydrolase [Hoylesella buccalis]|uniref:Esterase n=1 Tax=Hoylesella buccalis DNF00853 TaxID=1401074 RepID=A0A095ZQU2_9BACT|nr:serine hydrolase [Hoylesella buccalis]KGF36741.1 esterase [Hoylesella buccalis DNF00853]